MTGRKRDPIAAAIMADEKFLRDVIARRGIAPGDVDTIVSLLVEAIWKAGASGRIDVHDLAAMRRWVQVVARRLASDHRRAIAWRAEYESGESGILPPKVEDQLAAREDLRFVESRLGGDELRLLERILNDVTTAEIAAASNVPQGTVATRVRRLRARLRAALMRRSVIFAKLYAAEVSGDPPFPLPLVHATRYDAAETACGLKIRPVPRPAKGHGAEYLKPYLTSGVLVGMYARLWSCRLCTDALRAARIAEENRLAALEPAPDSER